MTHNIKMTHEEKNQNLSGTCADLSSQRNPTNLDTEKQRSTPVWKGLVMDQEARHYQKIKNAIWLYLYLLLHADRSGFLVKKVGIIGSEMGIKRDTVLRWLNILRSQGYITTRNTGRCLQIQIRAWENPSPDAAEALPQKQQIPNFFGRENPTIEKTFKKSISLNLRKKPYFSAGPIDTINKYILNNDIDSKNSPDSLLKTAEQSKSTELAMDIATALGDHKNLALYISYSRRFSERLLRRVLGEVKEIPSGKIKKSRGALFNYLVQKYAKENSHNLSN